MGGGGQAASADVGRHAAKGKAVSKHNRKPRDERAADNTKQRSESAPKYGNTKMNGKALIPLVAGLCVGGLALKMGFDYVKQARGASPQTVTVWTPATEIPLGMSITDEMLKPMNFPASLLPPGAIRDKAKLIGRVVKSITPSGVPVLDSMLLPAGAMPGLYVKPGFRAAAVKIDESSGVDNHLQPGCRVDVIGFFTVRDKGRQETISRVIIEDVEVAAVGERLEPEYGEDEKDPKKKPKPARAATLLVKPDKVALLHLAEQRGKIKLVMRNDEDSSVIGRSITANEDQLLGNGGKNDKSASPLLANVFGALFKGAAANASDAQDDNQDPTNNPNAAAFAKARAAAPPEKPKGPAWVTSVWNGNQRQVLGWKSLNSMEPFDMSAEQPQPLAPAMPPRGGLTPPKSIPPEPAQTGAPSRPDQIPPPPTSKASAFSGLLSQVMSAGSSKSTSSSGSGRAPQSSAQQDTQEDSQEPVLEEVPE